MPSSRLRPRTFLRGAFAFAIASLAIQAVPSTASAGGYGLYLDYAFGPSNPGSVPVSLDTSRIGVGFAYDSAVAQNKLFNYRMNLGYENYREKFNGTDLARYHQGSFENIFGFGVYRTKLMRVWLGPSLRIAAGTLDKDSIPGAIPASGTLVNFFGGGGVAAGVNVHTGKIGSAALTIGYQFGYQGKYAVNGIASGAAHGTENRVNFNFAYFFRGKGDRFEK